MTLDVRYKVEGQPGVFEITVDDTWYIGQLLEVVKEKYPSVKYPFNAIDKCVLDTEDLLRDWMDEPGFILYFLISYTPPKELLYDEGLVDDDGRGSYNEA